MFFQSIDINNYGSISDFHYSFRFDNNNHPIPLVLIGENGTGKTLTIANMVDALIEVKRQTYGENLLEVEEQNYYKIGSKDYISNGENSSRVDIKLKHGKETLKYIDIMSNKPEQISEDTFIKQGEIEDLPSFEENGYYKKASSSLKQKHYSEFISLYFPVDRFYMPLWYNNNNYKRINYSKNTNINQPDTNIIKVDVLSNIKDWLTIIYLQTTVQLIQLPDEPGIPEAFRGKQIQKIVDTNIQGLIKNAMNTILGADNYQPRISNRKKQTVSFSTSGIDCKDISQLSEGQMSLFAIALSIIKEWDVLHENFELSDIRGCVIIDEADLGLHINYMYECFPRMMQLFPNIQFIITTHSPFMIAGLYEKYGKDIDIITMPEGLKISDINAFIEVQKAQELISEDIAQIRDDALKMKDEITQLRKTQDKVYLFTEGPTDVLLLKKALDRLKITNLPIEINPASQNRGNHNDDAIKKMLETLKENPCGNNIVIGLFDRDSKAYVDLVNCIEKKDHTHNQEYVKVGEHIYAFMLPVPHNRPEIEQISIEHYFTDEEIMTENEDHKRLFMGKEFYSSGNHIDDTKDYNYKKADKYCGTIKIIEHEQKAYVTDKKGKGDFSLSKQRFAEAVRDGKPGFDNFDFSEFNKIFDVIKKILVGEQEGSTARQNTEETE